MGRGRRRRAAAVDAGDNTFLHDLTCDSMDLTSGVTVQFTDSPSGDIGDTASVQVSATPGSLSGLGLIEVFLPDDIQSRVEFRLEQDSADWSSDGTPASC